MCASAAPVRRRPRLGPVCRSSRVLTALLCLALAVGLLPVQTARSAVAQESPRFTVAPADDTIWGQHWQPGAEVTVVVAGVATSTMTDAAGTFTVTTAADIRAGDPVSVTEGATSRSHTVLDLAVDSIGVQADVVAGTTNVGTLSMVVLTDSGVSRHLDPTDLVPLDDGTFAWRADFSLDPEAEDLKFGSSGNVEQYDEDGDSTYSSWSAPNPHFYVDPVGDSLWGEQWAPEATVTVTVEGEHEPATTASDSGGNFRIDIPFDIQAGDRITVADGETTSPTYTVTAVVVTDLGPDDDTVSGTAEAGSLVHVVISPHRVPSREVTADAEGKWTADFGHEADDGNDEERATYDIAAGTGGFAAQYEVDPATYSSHWFAVTVVGWQVPPPSFPFFQVDHELDQLWGHEWPADAQLSIRVTASDIQVLDTTTGTDGEGNFSFNDSGFDLQPGQHVEVAHDLGGAGEIIKTHVITELGSVHADAATNTVCGAATAGSIVHVWIWADVDGERPWRSTDVDAQGAWCVDFDDPGRDGENIPYQLQPGDSGTAEQADDDGDVTHLSWRIAHPRFSVELLPYHLDEARGVAVHGEDWAPGPVAVAVQAAPEAVPTSTTTIEAAEDGTFDETLLATDVAVLPGHTVTVSQNGSVKTLLVSDLRVTNEDVSLDQISGTTSVNDLGVHVEIWADIGELDPYADPSAFVVLGDGTFGWTIDLHPFDLDHHQGMAEQVDLDGDATRVWWGVERPVLVVDPVRDTLWGHEWPRRAELTISVGDVGDPDYTITAVTDQWGNFPQWDGPPFEPTYDLQLGQTVTVAFDLDGPDEVRKSHVITALAFDRTDAEADTVAGSAEPAAWVDVYAHVDDGLDLRQQPVRHVQTDDNGAWTADFGQPGPLEDEAGIVDLQPGQVGAAECVDADGDATHVAWQVPTAYVGIDPDGDGVWGQGWPASSEVTIAVAGTSWTTPTDTDGAFWLNPWDLQFDFQAGQTVTVTHDVGGENEIVKTHVITELTELWGFAVDDRVVGWAAPNSPVTVSIETEGDGVQPSRHVVADDDGKWTADFSVQEHEDEATLDLRPGVRGSAAQTDGDGDQTSVRFWVRTPVFAVHRDDGEIRGLGWTPTLRDDDPANTVRIEILGGSPSPFETTAVTDHRGEFVADVAAESFELRAGQVVTVTDGSDIRTHTITALRVGLVDPATDRVIGTAEPNSEVYVHLSADAAGAGQWRARHVFADRKGNWTADFSVEVDGGWGAGGTYDIQPGTVGFAEFWDPDGDATHVDWQVPPAAAILQDADVEAVDVATFGRVGDRLTLTFDAPLDPATSVITPEVFFTSAKSLACKDTTLRCQVDGTTLTITVIGSAGSRNLSGQSVTSVAKLADAYGQAVTVPQPVAITWTKAEPATLLSAAAATSSLASFGRIGDRLTLTFSEPLGGALPLGTPAVSFGRAKGLSCADRALSCQVTDDVLEITVTGKLSTRNLATESVTKVDRLTDQDGWLVTVTSPVPVVLPGA
jgi:hypothetical protein